MRQRWLQKSPAPILVFTGIFLVGYALIWLIIYVIIKVNTEKLNKMLNP